MITQKSILGREGENVASKYLIENGFKIIERNFRKPWGEIDIIAKAKDKTLVFVEVKTMQCFANNNLIPEDQLTDSKLKKIQKTAMMYVGSNQNLIDEERGWRIDLIAISVKGEKYEINYYENL